MLSVVGRTAILLALALGAGGAGAAGAAAPEAPVAVAGGPATVLGLVYDGNEAELRRLDALTLRPRGTSRIRGLAAGMHSFSPDRRLLLLASGESPRLRFIDPVALRLLGELELPGTGWPSVFLWRSPQRVVVLLQGVEPQLVTVDVTSRRVARTQRLPGISIASDVRAGRLAVLLAPSSGIGTARLAVLGRGRPQARVVRLPGIRAGSERIRNARDSHAVRAHTPGVALSPGGVRALVVPGGNQVAEVDLGALRVRSRELSEPVSLLGRLRQWLDPVAHAKILEGRFRYARWLGPRYVAVTGVDQHGLKDGAWDVNAVGFRVIDTRSWSARTAADNVIGFLPVGDLLVGYGGGWPEGSPGTGVRAYGSDGRERFHALEDRPVLWVEASWPYLYVTRPNKTKRRDVIDLRSGDVVSTARLDATVSVLGP